MNHSNTKTSADSKKKRNILLIVIILLLAFIIGLIIYCVKILPKENYSKAVNYMNKGNYGDAIDYFEETDYKNSKEMIEKCCLESLKAAKVGEHVYFGRYGDKIISWTVIEEKASGKLIVADTCIDNKAYNGETENTDNDIDYNLWVNCSLRKWLNKNFYNNVFSDLEKKYITTTEVINTIKLEYSSGGGEDTRDKVFILSWGEIQDYLYDMGISDIGVEYWVRNPSGTNGGYATTWNYYSDDVLYADSASISEILGVRPAIWVDMIDNTNVYTVKSTTGGSLESDSESGSTNSLESHFIRCPSCGGSGKQLVTWYSEGDWGETSYSTYTCPDCNGSGWKN